MGPRGSWVIQVKYPCSVRNAPWWLGKALLFIFQSLIMWNLEFLENEEHVGFQRPSPRWFCSWAGISLKLPSLWSEVRNPENHMPSGPIRVHSDWGMWLCLEGSIEHRYGRGSWETGPLLWPCSSWAPLASLGDGTSQPGVDQGKIWLLTCLGDKGSSRGRLNTYYK